MPSGVLARWAVIEIAIREVEAIKAGMNAGNIDPKDGRVKDGPDKGQPYKGGTTLIREILRSAGLSEPADPIFEKQWQAYLRLKANSPIPPTFVVETREDGSPVTLGYCWVEFTLKPALKACLVRMRTGTGGHRQHLSNSS